jgi:hypothetical protein
LSVGVTDFTYNKPTCDVSVKGKSQVDRYLPMGDFAIFDMASRLGNLKPTKVMNRFSSFFNSGAYRFVNSRGRAASDLNSFEYFSLHDYPRSVCGLKVNLHLQFAPSIGSTVFLKAPPLKHLATWHSSARRRCLIWRGTVSAGESQAGYNALTGVDEC